MVNTKNDQKHRAMPLLPLKDIVVFPHMIVPVFISETLCIKAVEAALEADRKIFLSAFSSDRDADSEEFFGQSDGLEVSLEAPFDVYDVGTVCSIMRTRKLPDGRMKVLVQGVEKARIRSLIAPEPFPNIEISPIEQAKLSGSSSDIEAMIRAVKENLEKVVSLGKVLSPDILMILEDVREPGRLADLVAANLGLKIVDSQRILAISNPVDRLSKVHAYLSREIEVYQMQVKIQSQAKEEIGRMQKEHYLREQIRVMRSELGETDGRDELEDLWKKVESVGMNEEAKAETKRQLKRLERMHLDTSEATLTRTHVETMLSLPWDEKTKDILELKRVSDTLDEDHYGLDQVKDRIIEYLAVKKLNPEAKSPILCFVGPPGVGKTSLGKSIAKAMGRKFSRISLGGVRDEADVRGHRKTYVGAFPGRIIQALKKAGTKNPVVMLDEIDKLGSDHRGDPSSALLEVLDPSQNNSFVDHYLGVGFDLSEVFFIANANTLDTVPAPLRDRLEIIEVSGYSEEEKIAIASQFLIPRQLQDTGLKSRSLQFTKPAIQCVINQYTRESGLRGLEKQFASVCRKIARQFAEKDEGTSNAGPLGKSNKITPQTVTKLLGAHKFGDEFYHLEPAVGVSLGLAYTQYGGVVLAVETNLIPSKNSGLVLTGQLGDVMKESAQAAMSFVKSNLHSFGLSNESIEKNEIHVHVPAGGTPKDGPSAGITIATSIVSALLGVHPKNKTAMTGEISLHGKVLAIGGIKEKLLAAQREGMTQVILPEANRAAFMALPTNVKKKMTVKFVSHYWQVFQELFGMDPIVAPIGKPEAAATSKLAV